MFAQFRGDGPRCRLVFGISQVCNGGLEASTHNKNACSRTGGSDMRLSSAKLVIDFAIFEMC
jgi:hypothetical protein